jgi:hypothetical protein
VLAMCESGKDVRDPYLSRVDFRKADMRGENLSSCWRPERLLDWLLVRNSSAHGSTPPRHAPALPLPD